MQSQVGPVGTMAGESHEQQSQVGPDGILATDIFLPENQIISLAQILLSFSFTIPLNLQETI